MSAQTYKGIGYAYPSSPTANILGKPKGCFYIYTTSSANPQKQTIPHSFHDERDCVVHFNKFHELMPVDRWSRNHPDMVKS